VPPLLKLHESLMRGLTDHAVLVAQEIDQFATPNAGPLSGCYFGSPRRAEFRALSSLNFSLRSAGPEVAELSGKADRVARSRDVGFVSSRRHTPRQ